MSEEWILYYDINYGAYRRGRVIGKNKIMSPDMKIIEIVLEDHMYEKCDICKDHLRK
jgi:hypothetical protein